MRYQVAELLDDLDAGIITADASGHVRTLNSEALRLLDRPIDDVHELLGREADDLLATDRELTVEVQPSSQPERRIRVTTFTSPADGRETVLVLREVSGSWRGQTLPEAFLAMLSHELRTPVTSIHAAATLLRSRRDRLDTTIQDELTADIAEESERLLRSLEDLLVVARSDEAIRLTLEPILVQRTIAPAVEGGQRRWPRREISVRTPSVLPVAVGDEDAVRQVMRNLISNAVRHGSGPITVVVAADTAGDGVAVQVFDKGPGFEPSDADELFRPFVRSTRTAGHAGGAGIGLYVCRQLVAAMGGRTWARPRTDGGAVFGFWLPAYRPEAEG